MFRPVDWPIFGLKASLAGVTPTSGAAQPFRESGELFPRWAARPRRRLVLGLTCSLHGGVARRLLATFRAAHPDVDLLIEDLDDVSVRTELDGRHIDAAIASDLTARRGWLRAPLGQERLIAVLPESHALAADKTVAAASLREQIVVLAGDGSRDKTLQHAIAHALGGAPNFVHFLVERDTLFDLVGLGLGVMVCSDATLGTLCPGLCVRPIDSPTAEIGYSLMWRADAHNDALDDFIAIAGQLPREEPHHGVG
jgi:DNA-binding transcriptional LysR family regulator